MKVSITNFQSIKKADLQLGGLTLIVGPSNAGKSAILRSLEAALFNVPGNDFVTTGKSHTQVSIQFDSGVDLDYMKSKSTVYKVGGKEYSAVGRGQLSLIKDLGFYALEEGSLSVKPQFSLQHDPPFLVSSYYPGSLTSAIFANLNGAVFLGKAKHINEKALKTKSAESNLYAKELSKAEKILSRFAHWKNTSDLHASVLTKYNRLKEVEKYHLLVQSDTGFITKTKGALDEAKSNLSKISTEVLDRNCQTLKSAKQQITVAQALKKILIALKDFLFAAKNALEKSAKYSDSISKKKVLIQAIGSYLSLKEGVNQDEFLLEDAKNSLDAIAVELAKFKSCPLCGARKEHEHV